MHKAHKSQGAFAIPGFVLGDQAAALSDTTEMRYISEFLSKLRHSYLTFSSSWSSGTPPHALPLGARVPGLLETQGSILRLHETRLDPQARIIC